MELRDRDLLGFGDHETEKYSNPMLIFLSQTKINCRFSTLKLLKSISKDLTLISTLKVLFDWINNLIRLRVTFEIFARGNHRVL